MVLEVYFQYKHSLQELMRHVGDKVELSTGGYGGLNYENLVEHGWRAWLKVEIIKVDKNLLEPYLVRLPDNTTIRISDKDIKGI